MPLLWHLPVLLVTNFAAEAVFTPKPPAKPGFEIAVKEDAGDGKEGGAAAAAVEPIEKLLADRLRREGRDRGQEMRAPATPSRRAGRTASARISMASSASRRARAAGGFNFSAAMKAKGGTWTFDDLNKFLANPKGFVPGTTMGFAGLPRDSERADVIAYLNTLSDNPQPLPTAAK